MGFRSEVWTLFCGQQLAGVLDYVAGHPELSLLDMRYTSSADPFLRAEPGPPPWAGRVDGIITAEGVPEGVRNLADWMISGGVPVVNLGGDLYDPRIAIVHTSHASIGQLAAEHLMGLGISHFAHIGSKLAHVSALRRAAFEAALMRRGHQPFSCDVRRRFMGTDDERGLENQERELIELLKMIPKPAGIVALNDGLAQAVCRLAMSMGFAVPGDVAVLGVGNSDLSRSQSPSLSSIRLPIETIGRTAAKVLHDILLGRPAPDAPVQIDAIEVIGRASTMVKGSREQELDRGIEFLRRHACEDIDVEHVMQTISMSRRLFEQLFVQKIGRTPGQEMQRLRLERATQLLIDTRLSISQIASMVGFAETAAFSKFFRRHTGTAPVRFRKQPPGER